MVSICFYFQVHQPFRLDKYSLYDIGTNKDYFNEKQNSEILHKVAKKCYLKTNALMLDLLNNTQGFKITYSISGTAIEQFEKYMPEVLESFKKLAKTGKVEFLNETYHHSLAFFYSKPEFEEQVNLHRQKMLEHFNYTPKVFRNTELTYTNEIAKHLENMGFKAILIEGWDPILQWRSPNFLYKAKNSNLALLTKNYKLSDDIAFRFSDKNWKEHPLSTEKYTSWINNNNGNGEIINLFMDYETFGEHQWEDSGIFEFLKHFPNEFLKHPDNNFKTPSEILQTYEKKDELDVANILSWADTERDLSAWIGNEMQKKAIEKIYQLETRVKKLNDPQITEIWRKLQTSDHFYYMCTKYFSDGDVHKYFSAYDSPYEAFIYYMNVLKDFEIKLKTLENLKIEPILTENSHS